MTIATVIATLDERLHIERAIASARSLGPVYVVDSGSTDGTIELARSLGATVWEHPWEGYAAQKNWARERLPGSVEWVLHLDADEYMTPILREEIGRAVSGAKHPGFYLPRQNIFLDRVLRHAWWYPDYQLRLFRRDAGRYEDRDVHEHVLLDGEAGFLENALMHDNRKSIDEFVERHRRYASLEAAEMLVPSELVVRRDQRTGSLMGSWPERRRALKTRVWYRLPGRAVIRFLWMYVVRRGFLDGRQGLVYCQLIASYDAMIDAKLMEHSVSGGSPIVEREGTTRDLLVCPVCGSQLAWNEESAECGAEQRHRFPIVDEVPILLESAEVSHGQPGDLHKDRQASFFDEGDGPPEFEMTRPLGTPRLYRWMLDRKYSRGIDRIEHLLPGSTAIAVCGGSGMDAEYLARSGANVISADISLGAARRARERARRHGLPVLSIVADAECLPLADSSVDVAYVHDGLHHLAEPASGVRETARVASKAISITEPADAALTGLAVRAGVALDREEAGNRVARLRRRDVVTALRGAEFAPVRARRYGMFYRHMPGLPARLFSLPGLFALARTVWSLAAIPPLAGLGNKLSVQAEAAPTLLGRKRAGTAEPSRGDGEQ